MCIWLRNWVNLDSSGSSDSGGGLAKKIKDKSHLSDDGTYAMKKVLIQNAEQLEQVRDVIRVSSLFNDPNVLPLLDHAITSVKVGRLHILCISQATQERSWTHEAYLLFPFHLDGTFYFRCTPNISAGLKHMHNLDPPYAHNDVKRGNILITNRKGHHPVAILMDFGSALPDLQGDKFDPVQRHCSCRNLSFSNPSFSHEDEIRKDVGLQQITAYCRSGHLSIVQRLIEPLSFGIAP